MSKKITKSKKSGDIKGYLVNSRRTLRSSSIMAEMVSTDQPKGLETVSTDQSKGLETVSTDQPKGLEELFDRLSLKLDKQFEENRLSLVNMVDKKFDESNQSVVDSVEKKFDEHSEKFDSKIDLKFLEVQEKLGLMKENITHIEINLNTVVRNQNSQKSRQDEYDVKLNALEIKYLKLDQYMKDLSKRDDTFESALTFANTEIESLKKESGLHKQMITDDRDRIMKVETRCSDHEFKDEAKEQHSRKMNLWIYGVKQTDDEEDVWVTVCEFGKKVLELDDEFVDELMVKNAHRVGKNKTEDRPIIVAFLMAKDRMTFLKSAATLYKYNKEHNTKYGVKTDLAPKARAKRAKYNFAAYNWRRATGKILMVRCNDNSRVWMVTKVNHEDTWKPVAYIDPKWFKPQPTVQNVQSAAPNASE